MRELISVIIPTYNRHHVILDAVQSVENQTYKNWELIIVDDCSTDNTQMLFEQLPTVNYIKLSKNKGNAGARNVGVKKAKGNYIVFLDSDDQMEVHCLERFANLLQEKPDTPFAFGGYFVKNTQTGAITKNLWRPDRNNSFLRELKIGTGCGLMVKKECFEKVGYFDERLRVAVDTDWLIRLERVFDYEVIEDYLVTIFKHPGERVRNNKKELLKSYEIIYEKNKKEINASTAILFGFLYKLQWLNYQSSRTVEGNKFLLKQWNKGIFRFKAFVSFFLYNVLPLAMARKIHYKISGSAI